MAMKMTLLRGRSPRPLGTLALPVDRFRPAARRPRAPVASPPGGCSCREPPTNRYRCGAWLRGAGRLEPRPAGWRLALRGTPRSPAARERDAGATDSQRLSSAHGRVDRVRGARALL